MTPADRSFFLALGESELLARVIWRESANQPLAGQVAVACVPFNRLAAPRINYGKTLNNVLLKDAAFSCLDPDDPNYPLMKAGGNSRMLNRCRTIAELSIAKLLKDPTRMEGMTLGATHYHLLTIKPYWRDMLHYLITIGDHKFYLEI